MVIDEETMLTHGVADSAFPEPMPAADMGILESVALALNSTLELSEVLRVLAGIALDSAKADRCSILLLEDDRLVPTAARGLVADDELWIAFQEMGDLALDAVPGARTMLHIGAPIPIESASASGLIPREWLERFTLQSLVVVPLLDAGDPCGVMVVDYQEPRVFKAGLLNLLEAIGSYAAVAINNARLFEQTRRRSELQEALARAATHLVSPLPLSELAEELLDASWTISRAEVCAIGLLDDEQLQVESIAVKGMERLRTPISLKRIPKEIIETLSKNWSVDELIELGSSEFVTNFLGVDQEKRLSYFVLPISAEDHVTGGILLGMREGSRFSPPERAALRALAPIASAVLERIWFQKGMDRQVRQMRTLHDLGEVLARRMTADELVSRVNILLKDEAFTIRSMSFRYRSMSRHLGGKVPTDLDHRVWLSGSPDSSDESLCVPMRLGGRLVGSITVSTATLHLADASFVRVLADGIAQLCSRAVMRAEIEEAERERAIVAERGRIAADLHDTVGQAFVAVGLLARRGARDEAPEDGSKELLSRIADLADSGKWDIDHAIRWLALFPEARGGILPALDALTASFEGDSGLPIVFDRVGKPIRLPARTERALYRVACGALTNAWRFAGSSAIRMKLSFEEQSVTLSVSDDGIGASTRQLDHRVRRGVTMMRTAVAEVGGSFRFTSKRPRGAAVIAVVPLTS